MYLARRSVFCHVGLVLSSNGQFIATHFHLAPQTTTARFDIIYYITVNTYGKLVKRTVN